MVLVALAPDHSHWMSQGSADDPAARAEAWSRLEAALATDLATRDGCRAGVPLTRDDDPDRCPWCGIAVDAHELPADVGAGATYQETHIRIGDQVVTSVEAEAAMTVALAALKYDSRRGRHPGD